MGLRTIEAYGYTVTGTNEIISQIEEWKADPKNGINWNNYPTTQKRGSCCIRNEKEWIIDNEIPIFKWDGREYIEKLVFI